MKSYRFIREANGNVLAVMTLVVAALFGALGLTMSDDSLDGTQWSAVSSAHAVAASPEAKDASQTRPAEAWSADESAQGTRPDAAH